MRFDPELRFNWRQYQVRFFLGAFRYAADMIGDYTEFSRWDYLFGTLSHAQLGDTTEMARWRARLIESWPDLPSAEESIDDFSPATKERALWLDSHSKADLRKCATPEQLVEHNIEPLPECEAERAQLKATAQ